MHQEEVEEKKNRKNTGPRSEFITRIYGGSVIPTRIPPPIRVPNRICSRSFCCSSPVSGQHYDQKAVDFPKFILNSTVIWKPLLECAAQSVATTAFVRAPRTFSGLGSHQCHLNLPCLRNRRLGPDLFGGVSTH